MKPINLKKLITRKEELAVLEPLISAIDDSIAVLDPEGNRIIGKLDIKGDRFPVINDNSIIGYVSGENSPEAIADILIYLAGKKRDIKYLAEETLDKYNIRRLLYCMP
jgi:hypothetical protein